MEYLIALLTGYLFGSLPTAYLLLKKIKGIDVTLEGSGNMGAMNSFELTRSKVIGLLVFFIDAFKGLLSVYLMLILFPMNFLFPAIALLFAVFSHCFNPWLKFKGGRGLATAAGGSIILFPFMLVIWLLIWATIYLLKKDILFANIWSTFMTLMIIFTSHRIAIKYTFPPADTTGTMILFTTAMLFLIFIKHIEPLKEIIENKKIFIKDDLK